MKITYTLLLVFSSFFISYQSNAQCFAGDLQTTGTVTVPSGASFDLMVINQMIPPSPGGFGWFFDNSFTDGTGALPGGPFLFFNQTGTESFNNDLNGLLSSNNLPPFQGTWVIKGAAYTDEANSTGTTCSFTVDSLIVVFDELVSNCEPGDLQTTGKETVCDGDQFILESINVEPPIGGGFGWLFLNDVTGGTGALESNFILNGVTTLDTFDADLGGTLSLNNLPLFQGTWVVKAATFDNASDPFASICNVSEDSLALTFNPAISVSLDNPSNTSVTAAATGGTPPFMYSWSNGETGEIASMLSDGTLIVTVSDSLGCMVSDSISLLNTSIEELTHLSNYEISPNPTNSIVNIEIGFDDIQDLTIQLRAMDGKLIQQVAKEKTTNASFQLDLSTYQNGMYLLHVITPEGQFIDRIIKQ